MNKISIGCILLFGCVETLDDRPYLVTEDRILAIRGTPAEVRPGQATEYDVLYASRDTDSIQNISFSYCTEARRAETRQGVSLTCLGGDDLMPIQQQTSMLNDACMRFGPNTPPNDDPLEPSARPSDPDKSGGYYVPIQALSLQTSSFGQHRIRCDITGATRQLFEAFEEQYVQNNHPQIQRVLSTKLSGTKPTYELTVQLAPQSFEDYVVYSPETSAITNHQEQLFISWYVTSGQLSSSANTLNNGSSRSTVQLTKETEEQDMKGWVVVRDDRGGIDWQEFIVATD